MVFGNFGINPFTFHFFHAPLTYAVDIFLIFAITFGSVSITYFTSSIVFSLPMLIRIDPCARSAGIPVASNTCEGSKDPDAQAEPVEIAIPFKSRYNRIDSPSAPSKDTLSVLARQSFGWPLNRVSGILFSIGFLFKIPVAADIAAAGLIFWIFRHSFRGIISFGLGLGLPIAVVLGVWYGVGVAPIDLVKNMLGSSKYVTNYPLAPRLILVSGITGGLYLIKKRFFLRF